MTEQETEYLTMRGGIEVAVPRSLERITRYVLEEQRDWFEDEIRFVRRLLRPGDRVIDVGASYGVYALTAARLVGPQGRVLAFEPTRATRECLERSAARNALGNLTIVGTALSDREGEAALYVGPDSELNSLVACDGGASERVPLGTLDRCAADRGWGAVDFIKLDAEGEEGRILDGGRKLLEEASPLVMFEIRQGEATSLVPVDRLARLGYHPYRLVPGLGALAPFSREEALDPYQLNLFACQADRAQLLEERGLLARRVPDEAELAPAGPELWRMWLDGLPFAASLSSTWRRSDGGGPPGEGIYRQALSAYARAHGSRGEPPGHRHRSLRTAAAEMARAAAAHPGDARLFSLARVSSELGLRMQAVQCLSQLIDRLRARGSFVVDEPFLPVAARFEHLDPREDLEAFCQVSVLEQQERLRAFSSYYTGHSGLALVDLVQRLGPPGLADAEMGRRAALIRRRYHLPEGSLR